MSELVRGKGLSTALLCEEVRGWAVAAGQLAALLRCDDGRQDAREGLSILAQLIAEAANLVRSIGAIETGAAVCWLSMELRVNPTAPNPPAVRSSREGTPLENSLLHVRHEVWRHARTASEIAADTDRHISEVLQAKAAVDALVQEFGIGLAS